MTPTQQRDRELAEKIAAYFVESPPLNHYLQHATNIITTHLADEREALELADILVKRMEVIHADDHYRGVWTSYMIHGGDYRNGPTYEKELSKLKAALAAIQKVMPE